MGRSASIYRPAIRKHLAVLLWLVLLIVSCDRQSEKPVEFVGAALGTTYSIKIIGLPASFTAEQLHSRLKQVIDDVDGKMSVFKESSEVSIFNRSKSGDWFRITPDLLNVIEEAQKISQASDGAFDITLENLIELWGFGMHERPDKVPSQAEIDKALASSHYQHLEISKEKSAIRKTIPDLALNLSAIAKGYAVDAVADFLEKNGVNRYLVEIGGEIRTGGLKAENKPWLVAIERPEFDQRSIYKIIGLSDKSMATSGDYRNFYIIDGKKYSHTIDPYTGWPVENNLASVSVIHSSCMVADALATTFMAMGYEKGVRFARDRGYAVLWILRKGDEIQEEMSPAFKMENIQK